MSPPWTSEGDNDMRNLPVGRRKFEAIEFDVIDPRKNAGRHPALDPNPSNAPTNLTIPVQNLKAKSLYFMHTLGHSVAGAQWSASTTSCTVTAMSSGSTSAMAKRSACMGHQRFRHELAA